MGRKSWVLAGTPVGSSSPCGAVTEHRQGSCLPAVGWDGEARGSSSRPRCAGTWQHGAAAAA